MVDPPEPLPDRRRRRNITRVPGRESHVTQRALRRRLLQAGPLAVFMAGILGCAEAPPPPASAQIASNPDLVMRSLPPGQPALAATGIAAFGTVQGIDPTSREVLLTTTSGGTFTLTAGPDLRTLRQLRPGTRVVAIYDANGGARVGLPPRNADIARPGRLRGTIVAVEVGGRRLVVAGPQGVRQLVTIADPAMMAFVTRLAPGDEVAVTTGGP